MADISNKGLALILMVAMIVSIGTTIYSLKQLSGPQISGATGMLGSNQTGQAQFSINSSLSIIFNSITVMDFGTGYVNTSVLNCSIGSNTSSSILNGPMGCVGFNTSVAQNNFTVENNGNLYANVSLSFSKNASTFIGGSNGSYSFKYRVYNNESNSCASINNGSATPWQEVGGLGNVSDVATTGSRVCTSLNYSDANDTFSIGLWLRIPYDAPTSAHTVTITAIGCDDNSC